MTLRQIKKTLLVEALVLILFCAVLVHLITSRSTEPLSFLVSLAIIVLFAYFGYKNLSKNKKLARLLIILSIINAGFWGFQLLRYMGFMQWPLGYAASLINYAKLLGFHLCLSLFILVPLALFNRVTGISKVFAAFKFSHNSLTIKVKILLMSVVAGCWGWAIFTLLSAKPDCAGSMMGLTMICFLKAALTAVTEELCYRGVILPIAKDRYGVWPGIIFQASLYAAFHIYLGPAFLSGYLFIAGVWLLGLIFGIVTYLTGSICWPVLIHMALNVVIEWKNLS